MPTGSQLAARRDCAECACTWPAGEAHTHPSAPWQPCTQHNAVFARAHQRGSAAVAAPWTELCPDIVTAARLAHASIPRLALLRRLLKHTAHCDHMCQRVNAHIVPFCERGEGARTHVKVCVHAQMCASAAARLPGCGHGCCASFAPPSKAYVRGHTAGRGGASNVCACRIGRGLAQLARQGPAGSSSSSLRRVCPR